MSRTIKHLTRLVDPTASGFMRGGQDSSAAGFSQPYRPQRQNVDRSLEDGASVWTTGAASFDALLPADAISRSALHEIEPLRSTDMPSLTGFAFALLARLSSSRPIIWCVTRMQVGDYGHLYAHGCQRFGLSPSSVVFVKVDHPLQLHFALEEALKTEGIAAVMGEGPLPNFTGSRRLSMLAKTHATPCVLLNPKAGENIGSAAQTRWQIEPQPGVTDPQDPFGPGLPTWRAALSRCRGGHTSSQPGRIVWDEQARAFRPASEFSNGAFFERRTDEAKDRQTMVGGTGLQEPGHAQRRGTG